MLVDRIQNVRRLREKCVFDFVGGGDLVAGSHDDGRGVELVEGELGDFGGEGL